MGNFKNVIGCAVAVNDELSIDLQPKDRANRVFFGDCEHFIRGFRRQTVRGLLDHVKKFECGKRLLFELGRAFAIAEKIDRAKVGAD